MNSPLSGRSLLDSMVANPVCVHEDAPVDEVFRLFQTHGLVFIPVLNEEGVFQGAIHLHDLEKSRQLFELKDLLTLMASQMDATGQAVLKDFFYFEAPIDLRAREVMTVRTIRVTPETSLATVIQQLLSRQEQYAVVLDDNQHVLGLISALDLLQALSEPAL